MRTTGELARAAIPVLLGVLATACGGDPAPSPDATPAPRPPILFISLDTLRADRVLVDGAPRGDLMPRLAGLLADGVSFAGARAPMPFTLPSHMSMFTALYPEVHGVHGRETVLPASIPTLPERLQEAGYGTAAIVTNTWMKGSFGFARGFDSYDKLRRGLTYADRIRERAAPLLDTLADPTRPDFVFLHFLDPHSDFPMAANRALPYWTPPAHRQQQGIDEQQFVDADGHAATDFLVEADRQGRDVPLTTIADAERLYDDGLRYLDHELGLLLDDLVARGIYDELLIVVTSDHGEAFREHGAFIHSQTYDETIAVPLCIKLPRQRHAGRVVEGYVESVDIAPTLLELLGLPALPAAQGQSLVRALESGHSPRRWSLSQDKHVRTRFALLTDGYKLIHDTADGSSELYALTNDPGERFDLAPQLGERVEQLVGRLEALLSAHRQAAARVTGRADGASVLSEEEQEELRGIGYLR